MKIIFSDHAEIKITHTKIPKSYIHKTISSPDLMYPSLRGRDRYYKKFTKLHLRVIAKTLKHGNVVIITVHWVAKVPPKE